MQVYLCSVVHVQKFNSFRAAVDGTPLQIPAFFGGSRSYKILPSTLYIMSSIHLQSLKLLYPMVKEEMHLQENT